jgi:hypothetical protein
VTRAVRQARDIDLPNFATKADLINVVTRTDLAELELRLIKWVIGVWIAAILAGGGMICAATQILLHAHA